MQPLLVCCVYAHASDHRQAEAMQAQLMEDLRMMGEDFVALGDWNALPEEGAAGRCAARGL
eukprot:6089428-Alexandrium_andersonii.AAC.1